MNDVEFTQRLMALEERMRSLRHEKVIDDDRRAHAEWKCFLHYACQNSQLIRQAD